MITTKDGSVDLGKDRWMQLALIDSNIKLLEILSKSPKIYSR